jgi:hypothetical protein
VSGRATARFAGAFAFTAAGFAVAFADGAFAAGAFAGAAFFAAGVAFFGSFPLSAIRPFSP